MLLAVSAVQNSDEVEDWLFEASIDPSQRKQNKWYKKNGIRRSIYEGAKMGGEAGGSLVRRAFRKDGFNHGPKIVRGAKVGALIGGVIGGGVGIVKKVGRKTYEATRGSNSKTGDRSSSGISLQ